MTRPNFLFFITDQHRADYFGFAGHPIVKTPHIDRIAAQGTWFDNFHVATPVCMPNRASLLTGRYPSAHGLRYNGCQLSYRASTFTEVLRAAGYRTASIGKSHLQPMSNVPAQARAKPEKLGLLREAWHEDNFDYDNERSFRYEGNQPFSIPLPYYGYDHVDMVTGHGHQCGGHYEQWLRGQLGPDRAHLATEQLPHDYVCPQAFRTALPEELYSTAYIRDRAIQFLSSTKDDDRPFFAFVSFPDPHHPFSPPGHYWDLYDPASFPVRLPYESHRNPPPPMRWLHEKWKQGGRFAAGQEAFMASEREIQEAVALSCGMITMIDDAIGAILEALQLSSKADNTVLIFTSDHGDYLGDYNMMLKGALMQRSITNVAFLWSDPASRPVQRSQTLASTVDIAPSVIARAGLKPYHGIQGINLLESFDHSSGSRARLIIEHQDNATRMGFPEPVMVRTLLTRQFRMTIYKDQTWGELYDLTCDPDESFNLWDEESHRSIRAALFEELAQEMMNLVDQSPQARLRA